jgi:hypothetical protein
MYYADDECIHIYRYILSKHRDIYYADDEIDTMQMMTSINIYRLIDDYAVYIQMMRLSYTV